MKTRIFTIFFSLLLCLLSSACSSLKVSNGSAALPRAGWALLPIANHTETPQAGLRAESILQAFLHQRGLQTSSYPASLNRDTLVSANEQAVVEEALRWAREQGLRYAITGNVDEWRYKVGIDGEPAIGLSLLVWDLASNKVVWSAVAGRSGSSRDALANVARTVIGDMIQKLPLADAAGAVAK